MAADRGVTGETTKVITPAHKIPMNSGGTQPGRDKDDSGSSRSYPKSDKLPGTTDNATQFNPQKQAATDRYVGGVGPGSDC
jgi:hypothetical protein